MQIGNSVLITKNLIFWGEQTGNIIKRDDLLQNTMMEFIICCTLAKYSNMSKCEVESLLFFPSKNIWSALFLRIMTWLNSIYYTVYIVYLFISPLKTSYWRNLSIWLSLAYFKYIFRIYIYRNQEFSFVLTHTYTHKKMRCVDRGS